MLHRSKLPCWIFCYWPALIAVATLAPFSSLHAQEPAATPPATVAPSSPESPATPAVTPPATPDAATPAVAVPAPEPVNLGYNGLPTDPAKPVVVQITNPQPEAILPSSTADIFFSVDNYAMAEGGNRLHVILNNNDPVPIHDLRRPLTLKELPEGGHTVRVYAVQPDGHSLSNPESFAMVHFYIRKKNFQNYVTPTSPFLTVNLPGSGIVDIEDGGRVWFDFRTHNAPLSPKAYKVHYKINNVDGQSTEDKPVYWEGMKPGRYELSAELLDASNAPVQGVFNQIRRSFDVRAVVKALPVTEEAPAATPATLTGTHSQPQNQTPRRALPAED